MKKYLLPLVLLTLVGCAHGTIGFRQSTYNETPTLPMNEYLAKELGPGSSVTVLEGPNDSLQLKGSGLQFGAYTPFGNAWDFDVTVAVETYNDLAYRIQYTTNSGSGTMRMNYDVTGLSLDAVIGYRYHWFRPYLGLRRDVFTMMVTSGPLGSSMTSTISNIFALGGLEVMFPVSANTGISLKADYAQSLTKDENTKSANKVTTQVNFIWGLGKK